MNAGLAEKPTSSSVNFALLLGCFFLSGFAGLIFETAWTQQFSLVFGTSELAIATVLGAYMAGLALGASVAARIADRIRRPVRLYALLELAIGLTALAVPGAIRVAGKLQVSFFGGRDLPHEAASLSLLLFDLTSSFVILLLPTCLMGATLPLLARHVVRQDGELAPRVGLLYTVNTIGAAVGTLTAAFFFLPWFGLTLTVWVGVFINLIIFLGVFLLPRSGRARPPVKPASIVRRQSFPWILPLMLLSGVISFTYEIFWTRLLTHILGGSVFAFGTMLGTFLAGIAIGAAIAGKLAVTRVRAILGFAAAQLGIAISSLAGFAFSSHLPLLAAGWANDGNILLMGTALSGLTLLPGAICFGMTFPCAVKILAGGAADAGRACGRVFAWNTVGAIGGSLLAGFYLIPFLGFAGTVKWAVNASLGLVLITAICTALVWVKATAKEQATLPLRFSSAAFLLLALLGWTVLYFQPPTTPWRILRTSALGGKSSDGPVVFLGVGRSATVLLTEYGCDWRLTTNGLPESVIQSPGTRPSRFAIGRWLSLLPLAARPDTRSMLVIGLGGGGTIEGIPETITQIQVVEIEPEVVKANRLVSARRRENPLEDPRVSLHINDARNALRLSDKRFDAIVSQPSHPWTGAAANLFTAEFFDLVRSRLSNDGIFVQWIGLQFVDADLLRSLVATLGECFPYVELYAPANRSAVLFLASGQPLGDLAAMNRSLSIGKQAWAEIGVYRVEDILGSRELDSEGSRRFAAGAALIRDGRNLLQIRSPKAMRHAISAAEVDALFATSDPLLQPTPTLDRVYLARRLLERKQVGRVKRVATATQDPLARETIQGLVAIAEKRRAQGIQILTKVLRREPGNAEALAGILHLFRSKMRGQPNFAMAPLLSETARTLIKAWGLEKQQNWEQLRTLEASLLIEDPSHPFFNDCLHLRVRWRLEVGGPEMIQQGLVMSEALVQQRALAPDFLLRAQAAAKAENYPILLGSLFEILHFLSRYPPDQPQIWKETLALETRRIIESLPGEHPLIDHFRLKMLVQLAEAGVGVSNIEGP